MSSATVTWPYELSIRPILDQLLLHDTFAFDFLVNDYILATRCPSPAIRRISIMQDPRCHYST